MLLGIANTLASFQNMIHEIFKDLIDPGFIAYIDDIFIYSETKEKFEKLIKDVLCRHQKWDLGVSIDKCEFNQSEIEFLGDTISDPVINMA
jgi:hypothetical protein